MEFELVNPDDKAFLSYARARTAETQERDPVVGDTVHFWDGTACRAAIVTQDDMDSVCLAMFMPGETSVRPVREVPHDESRDLCTWHWPEMEQ